MDLILDTHTLIWFINGDHQLPGKSIQLIQNIENKCFISIASIWEIAIKLSLGKLELHGGFDEISKIITRYEFELLPVTFNHIQTLLTLDYHHRDPFDRIIISQGITEKLVIVTKDENFVRYNAEIIWN